MNSRQKNQTNWFRSLIESTGEPITVVSSGSGRLVEANSAFQSISGLNSSDIIGKTPADVGFLLDQAAYDGLLRDDCRQQGGELVLVSRSGEKRVVQPTTMTIEVANQKCLLIIWHDLTRQKEIEQDLKRARDLAIESAELKTQFLANVSHELRTPLTGIIGMAQLLAGMNLSGEQRECADTINQCSGALLNIVNDVLDFAKGSGPRLSLRPTDFELRRVVLGAVDLFRVEAARKGLKLELSIDPSMPPNVHADPDRIGQILKNLISNAIKFTQSGAVSVTVAQVDSQANSILTRFEVTDSGIGISAKDQQRIFEPFVQVDGGETRRYGGTGLGLSICAQLVEAMDGVIGVRSVPGQGSTFYFTVPLGVTRRATTEAVFGDDSVRDSVRAATLTDSPPDPMRILVVEDNVVTQLVLGRLLQRLGYNQVEFAADGVAAMEKIEQSDYDLILMDCQMPVMDGFQATARIRQREEGKRHTPVIAVTANAFEEDREKVLAAGADDYVAKPVTIQDLGSAISRSQQKLHPSPMAVA